MTRALTASAAFLVAASTLTLSQERPPQAIDPDAHYQLGPDSLARPGVPRGTVRGPFILPSEAYPGTQHAYWVYVPAQYDAAVPASLMVFNDGQAFKNMDGDLRVPNVLDNLIYRREIPVMLAVFINPGRTPEKPEPTPQNWGDRTTNRPTEYNSLDDRYARVIVDELLPALQRDYNISADPESRGIGGASSGAIAAFTVAWQRPAHFRKVLSLIGSFVNLRGGHAYAEIVRTSERKPLRIFLQDGRNDNRGTGRGGVYDENRDWFVQNVRLVRALTEKGYDVNYAWGIGRHSQKHGGAMLPDMLRWLWRDHPASLAHTDDVERSFRAPRPPQEAASTPPPDPTVPTDLRELLARDSSEMQLVLVRYAADRVLLAGNYQGGIEGGRGGSAPGGPPLVSVSTARVARLKRFDLDWQSALKRLDASRLSPLARKHLDGLTGTIAENLAALDAASASVDRIAPLLPFAPRIVWLYESRVRMEDVDSQRAAGELTAMVKEIAAVRSRLEAGLTQGAADGLGADPETANRGAEAVDSLRASLANWFEFFDGYDPVFTWWMGVPFRHADAALRGYAAFLRDRVGTANASAVPQPEPRPIPPAPPQKLDTVPDLSTLMALPRDEMGPVVARFLGRPAAGSGRAAAAPPQRDPQYYRDWLDALKSLDFQTLSRNAQVDYLFIRTTAERILDRAAVAPQADIPRKADSSGITGAARGRQGLLFDLADEMIPYTPEELVALGYRELEALEKEMRKASREMGFGDDWKRAVEQVKTMHPPPGGKPAAVRAMLYEAIDYLRRRDLITVPPAAAESLRMNMMSPERQLINPFFTGGAQITVSFPTNTMEYEDRLQSMRGNNIPFNHATAFHEMIPGHNLAAYMAPRFAAYRPSLGSTPFFGEGWPLYWEIILYEKGFHDTPAERVGALFWRMHRAARIVFSMNFHLGVWSPQECIDFLVERVGHERNNATAEVRRSFQDAPPLYQAAYLLGGLQLRSLRRELVESGRMTEKAFHDEVIRQGSMPIAWLRLAMSSTPLRPEPPAPWRFYGELPVSSRP
jgi:enterochelin esterase family protein